MYARVNNKSITSNYVHLQLAGRSGAVAISSTEPNNGDILSCFFFFFFSKNKRVRGQSKGYRKKHELVAVELQHDCARAHMSIFAV